VGTGSLQGDNSTNRNIVNYERMIKMTGYTVTKSVFVYANSEKEAIQKAEERFNNPKYGVTTDVNIDHAGEEHTETPDNCTWGMGRD
jgi:hypothetical protein